MAGELTEINQQGLISAIEKGDITKLIEPLIREIYLFDSFVAGTTHLKDKSVLDEIKEGDKLTLVREDNKFDDKAVMILTADSRKLGYIPERDNVVFSRLLDAGKALAAKVNKIEVKGSFHQISIGIYLLDF